MLVMLTVTAWWQGTQSYTTADPPIPLGKTAFEYSLAGDEACAHSISLGKTTKAVRDVFPEECTAQKPRVAEGELKVWHPYAGPDHISGPSGHSCGEFSCDEPAVGKAITECLTEDLRYCYTKDENGNVESMYVFRSNLHRYRMFLWSCADKTRILLHDEQEPPKFWCHKPQTND